MPTALNVQVSVSKDNDNDDDNKTTPARAMKKSNKSKADGGTKITPPSTSTAATAASNPKAQKKAQRSIASFFRQPTLSSSSSSPTKKNPVKKPLSSKIRSTKTTKPPRAIHAARNSGDEKDTAAGTKSAASKKVSAAAAAVTAPPIKKQPPAAVPPESVLAVQPLVSYQGRQQQKTTMEQQQPPPTQEELREIVLGCDRSTTNNDIVPPPPMNDAAASASVDLLEHDPLLPPPVVRKRRSSTAAAAAAASNGSANKRASLSSYGTSTTTPTTVTGQAMATTAGSHKTHAVEGKEAALPLETKEAGRAVTTTTTVDATGTAASSTVEAKCSVLGKSSAIDNTDSASSAKKEDSSVLANKCNVSAAAQELKDDDTSSDDDDSVMQVDHEAIRDLHGNSHDKSSSNDDDDDEASDDNDDTVDISPMNNHNTYAAVETAAIGNEQALDNDATMMDAPAPVKDIAMMFENKESGKHRETVEKDNCVDLTTVGDATASSNGEHPPKRMTQSDAKPPPPALGLTKKQNQSACKPSPSKLPPPPKVTELSAERKAAVKRNEALRGQYQARLSGLIERTRDGLGEENYQLPAPSKVDCSALPRKDALSSSVVEFPECAIRSLALLVQDCQLPLADLVATSLMQLKEVFPNDVEFHTESLAARIKLLATREPYVQIDNSRSINAFEDDNQDRLWRWEVISLDLLPDAVGSKIKKARTARKKVRSHSKALCTLLKYLDQANTLLQDPMSSQDKCNDLATKISSAEEKVLKYEREEEKVRLAAETKKKKEAAKLKERDDKQKEKALAAEQKKKEKEEREAMKRKKEEEQQKEKLENESKIKKQRTMMESFFTHQKSTSSKTETVAEKKGVPVSSVAAKSDRFWSTLNSSENHAPGPMFPSLSVKAMTSRKRRTRVVPVQVFATVMPSEGAFDAQPYAELQTIRVPNKYKFLSFKEDCRPPYHGTWSKSSSIVTGQHPLEKDTAFLDYDIDSEAEWEEGDDEFGEDCEDDGPDEDDNIVDEEGDTRMYNYQDGWLAADDDLGDDEDDIDEDTKLLRKKKLQGNNLQQAAIADQTTICIIAPGKDGTPPSDIGETLDEEDQRIEGVSLSVARELLSSHTAVVLSSEGPCLDAFPPVLVEEGNLDASTPNGGSGSGKATNNEMSQADLITFVKFVHHCKLPSKDKLVEELRTAHTTITSSRAQATRKLDSIAEKKKHPAGGFYWEVKRGVLEELGLDQLLNMKVEVPATSEQESSKASPTEKSAPGSAKRKGPPTTTKTASVKKKKSSSSSEDGKGSIETPASVKGKAATKNDEASSNKKRPAPTVNDASAKLFANFLKKKKTEE